MIMESLNIRNILLSDRNDFALRFVYIQHAGFLSRRLNEGPKNSQCGVQGSLIMSQRFVVLKRLELLPKNR